MINLGFFLRYFVNRAFGSQWTCVWCKAQARCLLSRITRLVTAADLVLEFVSTVGSYVAGRRCHRSTIVSEWNLTSLLRCCLRPTSILVSRHVTCMVSLEWAWDSPPFPPYPFTSPPSSLSFSIFYFSFFPFFTRFIYFLYFSIPSHSTRIHPLRFQARCCRRWLNLALVCFLLIGR